MPYDVYVYYNCTILKKATVLLLKYPMFGSSQMYSTDSSGKFKKQESF